MVTFTATDASGNQASGQSSVTVVDTTPPGLTVPAAITMEGQGPDGVPITDPNIQTFLDGATATDIVDPSPVITNDAPADFFGLGTTMVTFIATDASGNQASCQSSVIVVDTTPPTITPPGDVEAIANTPVGATGVDLGIPMVSDIVDPSPTITNDAPSVFPLGDTVVTWTATDHSANSASVTQLVTVKRLPIRIDIKPGSDQNPINLKSKGKIPVAIINDDTIDPALVIANKVLFGPGQAKPIHSALEDVDNDGDVDLILHFNIQEIGIQPDDTSATLLGGLTTGWQIIGEDVVITVTPLKEDESSHNQGQGKDK